MKLNIGSSDRLVRILAAVVIAGLYFTDQISGLTALALGAIAVIFVLTGAIGFCPLYAPFSFSTKKDSTASRDTLS
ncbi:MAG: DUF2892 domain-containing protein [Bacteroidota bacterium]